MKFFNRFRKDKTQIKTPTAPPATPPVPVEEEANWRQQAVLGIEHMALSGKRFTSDDVQAFLRMTAPELRTNDPRVLGPLFQMAFRDGLIVPTGEFWVSNRKSAHRNPKRVWVAAPAENYSSR